jgi:hypothetical protein
MYTLQCCSQNFTCFVNVCTWEIINALKILIFNFIKVILFGNYQEWDCSVESGPACASSNRFQGSPAPTFVTIIWNLFECFWTNVFFPWTSRVAPFFRPRCHSNYFSGRWTHRCGAGLPDFTCCVIPKPEKCTRWTKNCTRWTINVPNKQKLYQMKTKIVPIEQKLYQMKTQFTKWKHNLPNENTIYQMKTQFTKWKHNLPNENTIYQMVMKYPKCL